MTRPVDHRQRPAGAVEKDKALTLAAGETPFAATLGRLAAKARLALRLADEGKGQIFAREDGKAAVDGQATGGGEEAGDGLRHVLGLLQRTRVAGEAVNLATILGRLLSAGEEPVAAEERPILRRISSIIAGDEGRIPTTIAGHEGGFSTTIPGQKGGFTTTIAGGVSTREGRFSTTMAGQQGQIIVRATPGAGEDGEAARVRVLNTTRGGDEEAGDGLRLLLGLLKRTPVAGEAANVATRLVRLVSAYEDAVAGEERRVLRRLSSPIAREKGFTLVARLGLPVHSTAWRFFGMGQQVRFHSSSAVAVAEIDGKGTPELGERITTLEVNADRLERRVSGLEYKVIKIRRGLIWVQAIGLGVGTVLVLGGSTVYYLWDMKKIRGFFREQSTTAIQEYGSGVWSNTKSNASHVLNVCTFGYFGTAREENKDKEKKK